MRPCHRFCVGDRSSRQLPPATLPPGVCGASTRVGGGGGAPQWAVSRLWQDDSQAPPATTPAVVTAPPDAR